MSDPGAKTSKKVARCEVTFAGGKFHHPVEPDKVHMNEKRDACMKI